MPIIERLKLYALLIRLDRPIGILLLLWPTLWALWIAAEGIPDTTVLLVFIAGVFLMRSAGCAINDFADREFDPHVARTKNRPLAAKKISTKEAVTVFAMLSLTAFGLVLLMNTLTIWLSVAGLALAVSYPFMKRYHYLPQVHLGAAFGWSVPMAFTAQANEFTSLTWLLFMATVLWATAYDTLYAMADRDEDLKIGVKSTAILFGENDRLIIGIIEALLLLDLWLIGRQAELGMYYWLGLAVASGFLVYQHFLIRQRQPQQCLRAFLNNNWFGLTVFAGIAIDYWAGTAP
ncbi:MAG: 4-hydroxybenzoate polyprenyltransferase [Pseudomonadota bacterium]|nr:4-hydroxybenzoate polyprenyltransferase [Pseudomonadota bacterium]